MTRHDRPSRFWEYVAVVLMKPLSLALMRRDWRGREHIPGTGGVIIAANHLSWTDPVLLGHYLYDNGRWPVFLAKSGIFGVPVLGKIVAWLRTIPVYRDTADAANSLRAAERAVRGGACVIFYPEGTCTRDPNLWPMSGKTGAARLALATGAPVVPVAHWGAQELLPYGAKRPRPFPRKTFHIKAGPPVDLSRYAGRPAHTDVLRDATADIIAAITAQLADIRGEKAPDVPFDRNAPDPGGDAPEGGETDTGRRSDG
ncbi:lysophospholipid acyltransferase family protein [Spongiactinospora sp. TRM90649]|uniref:lysophospholipid acyltransferase family protein n=1 Tax=Spongiactinospora sp. TRM90649 TaxID=3031114 RepID=UPI0023F8522C|nr:lysophospholipid acyltransferase family protein [Spongiactinospora sp. TRM90649]MDF5753339.1 lysophospholipid acyltransferase family protein [Spongiactinospora sp. TRM90649]